MNDEYEIIDFSFMDKSNKLKGENKEFESQCPVLYFPNRQIATICDTIENQDTHEIESRISKPGMTKEEMHKFFISSKLKVFSINYLIRSIIYEAYRKEGLKMKMDEGNVRHFWYTHLKEVLIGKLGLQDDHSIETNIMIAWRAMINSGAVTYEDMNIISDSESGRLSVIKDSPFNNIIIAVEKMSFFNSFSWIPKLFNCTLIAAGGTPSRAVTRRFILELKELGVDLDQDFHMCTASDLDPAGYHIQEAFKDQFDKAIEYYGGMGTVELHRLFVRKDQVTPELLTSQAIPWKNKVTPGREKWTEKRMSSIWERFCEKTDGGLYITDSNGKKHMALLEMDVFSATIIEKTIVNELLKIIRETSDETKIMIPEIMRVFNELKKEVSDDLFQRWEKTLIEPLKKEFFKEVEAWEDSIRKQRNDLTSEINERYDELIEGKNDEKQELVPELFEKKEKIEEQIEKLKEKLSEIEEKIDDECEDIDDEISQLDDNRNDELQPIEEAYDFRMERYNQFKEEKLTVFNPIEQSLKTNINKKLTEIDHRFRDIETRDSFKKEIKPYSNKAELLIDENISCFEHPAPAFKGERLLEKASKNRDINIEKVRDSFTPTFMNALREIWDEDTQDMSFELDDIDELKDISQDVKMAIEETERSLTENQTEDD